MPKKKKQEVATAPLPPIDHSYVQALKIQNLEERNEALRKELQQLKDDREEHRSNETDVVEHMQRDLRSKSERIGQLQRDLQEMRAQLEEANSSKETELTNQRHEIEAERMRMESEMQKLSNELHDVKVFKERRNILENELVELRRQVDELKTRHEVEVGDMKREFDLKYADVHTRCNAKVEEIENSVEARAMQRVDAVTKRTIVINNRQTREIENLHKEVDELRRKMERGLKENQALRFEVQVKSSELAANKEQIMTLKSSLNEQAKATDEQKKEGSGWQHVAEQSDKQSLELQSMVKSLQECIARQEKQIQHYQTRAQQQQQQQQQHRHKSKGVRPDSDGWRRLSGGREDGGRVGMESARMSFFNFIGQLPGEDTERDAVRDHAGASRPSTHGMDWFVPLQQQPQHLSRGGGGFPYAKTLQPKPPIRSGQGSGKEGREGRGGYGRAVTGGDRMVQDSGGRDREIKMPSLALSKAVSFQTLPYILFPFLPHPISHVHLRKAIIRLPPQSPPNRKHMTPPVCHLPQSNPPTLSPNPNPTQSLHLKPYPPTLKPGPHLPLP
jgi:chromosome segregation ATPase